MRHCEPYALIALLAVASGCSDAPVELCGAGLCPKGTACVASTGECVPVPGSEVLVGDTGIYLSSALSRDGALLVASYDTSFRALVLREQRADGEVLVTRVDGGADSDDVGAHAALALDKDDQPHIAYYDRTHKRLKVASRSAGVWSVAEADGADDVGRWASIVVDDNANVHVAYRDETNRRLRVLSMASAGCRPEGLAGDEHRPLDLTHEAMAEAGMASTDFGEFTGIAISGDHKLVFSFYDAERGNLVLGRCDNSQFDLQILDGEDPETGLDTGDVGLWSSLAVDVNGDVGVAYFDRTRGVLKYAGSEQGIIEIETVDDGSGCDGGGFGAGYVGQQASLAMFTKNVLEPGRPRIAYMDATRQAVLLARRSEHGAWSCSPVRPDVLSNDRTALIGTDGLPHGGIGLGLDVVVDDTDAAVVSIGEWTLLDGGELALNVADVTVE